MSNKVHNIIKTQPASLIGMSENILSSKCNYLEKKIVPFLV